MFASGRQLKRYQHEDLEKLLARENGLYTAARGPIIAYPTGLGKTPLMIAIVTSTMKSAAGPTLIIVPSGGVLQQWKSECKAFAPGLKISVQHPLFDAVRGTNLYEPAGPHYPLFCISWNRVILDEAHNIRNYETKRAKACFTMVEKARYAACLTATPAQNSFRDFYSYFKFLNITDYGLHNWGNFNAQIVLPLLAENSDPDPATALLTEVLLRHVIWQPKDLISLPSLQTHTVNVTLTPAERGLYRYIQSLRLGRSSYVQFTRERQVCDHGALVRMEVKPSELLLDGYDSDVEEPTTEDDLDGISSSMAALGVDKSSKGETEDPWQPVSEDGVRKWAFLLQETYRSSKMCTAIKILKEIRQRSGNEKTIVFSHFKEPLSILHGFLKEEGFSCVSYTGMMTIAERGEALSKISHNAKETVILMSLKSGSDGLNVAACNNVILLEPWWNPYVERQAIGRIHRLGQTRPSHVYRLLTPGTIEMQVRKKQLEKEASIDLLMGSFQDLKMEDMEEMLRATRDDTTDV
ncbi:P-loop containing nucleoside triphosphate hydrolase protein [Dentipellis sp. KUC8613]|nr:P-loop containing nucleoside triphosphate hydrolase protein [Dentipellis sp. KUC8613]